jgi:capsule biosynthesis phosphatase
MVSINTSIFQTRAAALKRIVIDVDNTLTDPSSELGYEDVTPNESVVSKLREYSSRGFEIVLFTSRNMRTYKGNVGKINANTLPVLIDWLGTHDIPYDEIWTGKPWCGEDGFYVDDKAIRPDEFARLSYDEIRKIVG